MDIYTICYFATVWLVSALAGTFRTLRNGDFRSIKHLVAIAGVSGFLGFAIVAIFAGDISDPDFNGAFFLGVSALAGLAGKEQTDIISWLWNQLTNKGAK